LINAVKSHLAATGKFRPEIAGRIDKVCVFKPGRGGHVLLLTVGRNLRLKTAPLFFVHQIAVALAAGLFFPVILEKILGFGNLWNPAGHSVILGVAFLMTPRLDRFVTEQLIPAHTRGHRRKRNPEYSRALRERYQAWRQGDRPAAKAALRRVHAFRPGDPMDQGYRRLRYVRYADDHLLGFIGPKAEAEQIKQQIADFLHDQLKLELSQPKTLITHAATTPARFLGYEIAVQHNDRKMTHRRRMPIIMLSASDYETDAWRVGVDAFLKKPDQINALPSTINRLLKEGSRHA